MSDEIAELDDVAGVGIYERLVPHCLAVVLDLHNVCEGNRTILLRDIFDLGRVAVVRPPKLTLSFGDRIGGGDGRRGRGDVGCGQKRSAKQHKARITGHDVQGLTNEDPKETTLLALLNATLATAFATGIPFCEKRVRETTHYKDDKHVTDDAQSAGKCRRVERRHSRTQSCTQQHRT